MHEYDLNNEEFFDNGPQTSNSESNITPLLRDSSSTDMIDMEVQTEANSKLEEMKTKIMIEKPNKYSVFINAPITKFVIHVTAYIAFLALFTFYYLYKITYQEYNIYQFAQLCFLS